MKALKDVREELLKDKEGVDEVPLETLIANLTSYRTSLVTEQA